MARSLVTLTSAMLDAARAAGAEAADAIAVEGTSQSIDVRAGALEQAERSEGVDIGLRVLIGRRQACVSASDLSPDVMREMAERAAAAGRSFIDAPVSGGQAGAEAGKLTVMCGGEPEAFDRARPVMEAYAQAIRLMGPPGSGQLTKMVNQICIAGVVQGLAEGLHFAQRAGLEPADVLAAISKGAAQSWQMDNRWPTMAQGRFDFGFAVDWMRKDLGLVLDEAQTNGARLDITRLVDGYYAEVQAMGGSRWDTSSLVARLNRPT